jgi:hypothetical protein
MQSLQLPQSVIDWTRTFLEERLIRLAFDGQIEDFLEVEMSRSERDSVW